MAESMPKKRRYRQIVFEKGRFSDWVILRHEGRPKVHMVGCCDCGLVHASQFEAWLEVRNKKGKLVGYRHIKTVMRGRKTMRIFIVARHKVDRRATAGKRRAAKFRSIRKALR